MRPVSSTALDGDVHHPQGLCRVDGVDWLSTVDLGRQRGLLVGFDADGHRVAEVEITDGPRFHPGGCDAAGGRIVVPVAEYRPRSTAVVRVVDPATGTVEDAFSLDDHLGAAAALPSGDVVAATWGSREWLRLGPDGEVRARRANPSHFVDVQDVQVLDEDTLLCTGVGHLALGDQLVQIGGLALLDARTLELRLEVPVTTLSPGGRVLTHNPVRAELVDGRAHLVTVPDDGRASRLRHSLG